MSLRPLTVTTALFAFALVTVLAGCTSTAAPAASPTAPPSAAVAPTARGSITVRAGDTSCELSATTATAGAVSFSVENTGTQVNEFYVYGPGDRIVSEVENIGPSLTRRLTTDLAPGGYTTACKPGGAGDGLRAPFTVTATP